MHVGAALRWRPSDPGRFALRTAIRTGVVLPIAMALGLATGNDAAALFASFGTFALLVFADFGGSRPARLRAYAVLAIGASGLIALGTLCSNTPVPAALAMFVVGFAILFSGVLNGYFAAGSLAALLTYVLPALVPADASDIPARLAGWWIAVALCVPAAFLLLPGRPRDRVRAGVATACRALATYARDPTPEHEATLGAAVRDMHERFAATPYRPSGATGATGALGAMVDELDVLQALARRPSGTAQVPTPGEVELRDLSADALFACAGLLDGTSKQPPDRAALLRGRERVLDDLDDQLDDPALREDGGRLWAALRRAFDVRVLSFVGLELAAHAVTAAGGGREGVPAQLAASERVATAHADARSVWFRNSVRGAAGLAIAVLVAGELSVQHAFWVVLGSLSVLRSSALNTGASIVQALLGTVIGIAAGGLLMIAVGSDRTALWIVLPFAGMLAAYAPRAVSFAAGQAGFTVAVLVIFDILAAGGWEAGLVRLEDVSIGFAISLGAGLLMWPRGAASMLRRSLDDAIAATARYLQATTRHFAHGDCAAEVREAAIEAEAAQGRLDIAYRQRLAERASGALRLPSVSRLTSAPTRLRGAGDALTALAERVGDTPRPHGADALVGDAEGIAAWYTALGHSVAAHETPPADAAVAVAPRLRSTLAAATRDAYASDSRERRFAGAALAFAAMLLDGLEHLRPAYASAAADLLADRPS